MTKKPTPAKRTVRTTKAGNVNGYVGGKFDRFVTEAFKPWTDREIADYLNNKTGN